MGPLAGVRIVEMAGIGPAPFCAMLLAEMGAEVIRVDRPGPADLGLGLDPRHELLNRSKRAAAIDLKTQAGVAAVLRLIAQADILIEGFRPGVMERLGLGPDACKAVNRRLVYGRMTGWGQDGPLAQRAGHDINYIAMTGALAAIGTADAPVPPLNLVGDFGGGALYLAMGVLAALVEARRSGEGQVVDAAMVDGAASLMTMFHGLAAAGQWSNRRAGNVLDGAAPFYTVYATADGRHVAVGAIEKRFYLELLRGLGLDPNSIENREDRAAWPALRARFAAIFASRTRDDWEAVFANRDACVSPVLDMEESARHPLALARAAYVMADGPAGPAPAPAPRFGRTPGAVRNPPLDPRADTRGALSAWGFTGAELDTLAAAGVIVGD
ncbi:CaiB/BaiF CoA transferase family protein [Alsobacter sp. R-9]